MFPAKEAPASSHTLVSRADSFNNRVHFHVVLVQTSLLQASCKAAHFLQRNLVDPASSHMLVSWAELFQKKVSGSIPPGSATKRNANEQAGASKASR